MTTSSEPLIESVRLREMPEALTRELHAAMEPLHWEATPDEPLPRVEQAIAETRGLPEMMDALVLLARDSAGRIIGSARVVVQDLEGSRHIAQTTIKVLPDHRRAGIGRALLREAVEAAERFQRTLLMGFSRENVPAGEAFARRIGAELGQVVTENRLDLRSVDRSLLRTWIEDGPRRAPGYHLRFVRGETPEELAPDAARILEVMNTAPRDNLDQGDFSLTAEQLRDQERAVTAAGFERWALYAVEEATGRFVGLTDVGIYRAAPERIHVGNTVVEPDHRGHAIGKWLKAAMTQRVLDDLPDARWLITSNAAGNEAILAINRQLGFRPSAALLTWQLSVERAREYLAAGTPSEDSTREG